MKWNYEKPYCEIHDLELESPVAASAPDYEDGGNMFSGEYYSDEYNEF